MSTFAPATGDRVVRKHAAIFYADAAGYGRLTDADEVGTHQRLCVYLDVVTAIIEDNGGRTLHFAGDAILAEFADAARAVAAAVEVQRDLAARNAPLPDARKLKFRIGVNEGDVIVDRDELYGRGVNIAARLSSLATPGEICISEAVSCTVAEERGLSCTFMGDQQVKDFEIPVRAYRLAVAGSVAPTPSAGLDRLAGWSAFFARKGRTVGCFRPRLNPEAVYLQTDGRQGFGVQAFA